MRVRVNDRLEEARAELAHYIRLAKATPCLGSSDSPAPVPSGVDTNEGEPPLRRGQLECRVAICQLKVAQLEQEFAAERRAELRMAIARGVPFSMR
jgi:hypothetical protein